MKTKNKIFIEILAFLLIFTLALPASANSEKEGVFETLKSNIRKGTNLLYKLESSLEDQKKYLEEMDADMQKAAQGLRKTYEKMRTLKGQLQDAQERIALSNKKILTVRKQIAERETELELLHEKLKKFRKKHEQLRVTQASILGAYDSEEDRAGLPLFLSSSDLSDVLQKQYFLKLISQASQNSGEALSQDVQNITKQERETVMYRERLMSLRKQLEQEKKNLLFYQESKQRLLALTKGDEKKYEELLEQSKQEQVDVFRVIERLKENYTYVAEKLNALKSDPEAESAFSAEDYERALREAPISVMSELRWPVSPVRGISAYFHDGAYQKAMGIAHNAIDIRVIQKSVVRAAATGVVSKVVDGGTGYSYIILSHKGSLLTLYGHMYDIFVKEGDTVFSGQQIGLSGGIPGTKGAGWLTTGAHLHFEVFKDWKHVDPLEYLPLEYLPIEYLPEKYATRLAEEKVHGVKRISP